MNTGEIVELMIRIEQLEARVLELEARPIHQIHYHTHPAVIPAPFYIPTLNPTCGG